MAPQIIKQALKLPVEEKLQLIEELWNSISGNSKDNPITEEQKKELDRRLENYYENPENVIKWDVLRAELFNDK